MVWEQMESPRSPELGFLLTPTRCKFQLSPSTSKSALPSPAAFSLSTYYVLGTIWGTGLAHGDVPTSDRDRARHQAFRDHIQR